jgi:hypothetical protein
MADDRTKRSGDSPLLIIGSGSARTPATQNARRTLSTPQRHSESQNDGSRWVDLKTEEPSSGVGKRWISECGEAQKETKGGTAA